MATAQGFLVDSLIPQRVYADPDQRHRARVLIFAAAAGALCALICLAVALAMGFELTIWQMAMLFVPHLCTYPLLRVSGNVELATYAFLFAITSVVVSFMAWGVTAAMLGMILVPMSAVHVGGARAGVVWTIISALVCGLWAPQVLTLSATELFSSYVCTVLALMAGASSITVEQFRMRAITALQDAKQSLVAERLRTRETLVRAFPVVLELNAGQFKYLAPGTAALLGYEDSELKDRALEDLVHPGDLSHLRERRLSEQTERLPLEVRLRHQSGQWLWLSVYVIVSDTLDDEPSVWTIAGHDISEEKNEQVKLIQAQRLESIGVLAAGLAHDFNNMLTVIGGYADLLDQGEVKERISDTVDDAAILVQKLMAFGRSQQFVAEQADVSDVLDAMHAVLASVLGPGISFEIEVTRGEWWVGLSATQLNQVFLNLITNAKEAMGDKGKLVISVSDFQNAEQMSDLEPGNYVCICVQDDGIGMDTETLQYVFDPFFTTKQHKIGAGLGLSSVYGILKGVGGTATIESEPEQGTTVRVFVPVVDQRVSVDLEPVVPAEVRQGRGSVLVVEDDQLIADLIARNLLAEGFNVTIKHDVTSAWDQLQQILPDLLITDIMMPDGRGTELAQRLRAETVDIPILFISGYSDQEVGEWKDAEGQIRFLAKPFRRKDLISRVNELIQSQAVASGSVG